MRFKATDIDKILAARDRDFFKVDGTLYALYLFSKGDKNLALTLREYNQLAELLRYYCRKDSISWLAVYSTTSSDTAQLIIERTGKRGRPKKRISGCKIAGHTHIAIIGNEYRSAYSTATKLKKAFDKKYGKPICRIVSKGSDRHAYNYIGYCYKQADFKRSGGDFDFKEYLQEHNKLFIL
jgi:hypothetical protein